MVHSLSDASTVLTRGTSALGLSGSGGWKKWVQVLALALHDLGQVT